MMRKMNVAIVGATGAVGTQMIKMLEDSSLPLGVVKLLASKRSAGKQLSFKGEPQTIEELVADSFEGIDLALFSAGGGISAKFAPEAVKRGAVVVDNTSHFRMDPEVPLVVPEVNPEALREHHGIIANPNDGGLRTDPPSLWLKTSHCFHLSSGVGSGKSSSGRIETTD